jgi:hypothetical protein
MKQQRRGAAGAPHRDFATRTPRVKIFVSLALGAVAAGWLAAAMAKASSGRAMIEPAALYPDDRRRPMTSEDYRRYPGAGVLFCRDGEGVPRRAAAAWLIESRRLVMMNAHNFRDPNAEATRGIDECFFQIAGRNYAFSSGSLELGVADDARRLHITDDWALARLREPVDWSAAPQPVPRTSALATGDAIVEVTMVSPAGHANFTGPSSIETCAIHKIDPPTEDGIRRARHDCNDGYGGSGSGLFDEAGHLIAMQSASLDMNRRLAFDIGSHYGSAILIEGKLLDAILQNVEASP